MKAEITYLKGDATAPTLAGNKIIVHVCNDIGGWGKGFSHAISDRWKEPEMKYRQWFLTKSNFAHGEVQFIRAESKIWVASIIAMHNIYPNDNGLPPIRYEAIKTGLEKVAQYAIEHNASVHMPRIGCGIAGGNWDTIRSIISETLCEKGIFVYVYDL